MSDSLSYDVVVVGAGPAGLATALRLRALHPWSVCVLEKGARVGAHLLSGALIEPEALARVAGESPPFGVPVGDEALWMLGPRRGWRLPAGLLPRAWRHDRCGIYSLGEVCRWLAARAEAAGVELFPGTVAAGPLWQEGRLAGVVTGELGRRADGNPGPAFQPGLAIRARVTLLAEGCRGSVTGQVVARLGLAAGRSPQTYGLGLKTLWRVPRTAPGRVVHTLGWPLTRATYGGGFLYQVEGERVAAGLVVGLDYADAGLDPVQLLRQWQSHPRVAALLAGGEPLAFGARTLVEGGWSCLPRLVWDGGLLVGDAAGLLDLPRLRGVANALASGTAAGAALHAALTAAAAPEAGHLAAYPDALAGEAWFQALRASRNVRPGFRAGRPVGLVNALWEGATKGRSPWSWQWRQRDRDRLRPGSGGAPGLPRTDLLALASVREPSGPSHLYSRAGLGLDFGQPETRYCPAGVFQGQPPHYRNCLHCKCCDIKDPEDRYRWTPPEGGSGPDYAGL